MGKDYTKMTDAEALEDSRQHWLRMIDLATKMFGRREFAPFRDLPTTEQPATLLCALCQKYEMDCKKACPLGPLDGCCKSGSTYSKAVYAKTPEEFCFHAWKMVVNLAKLLARPEKAKADAKAKAEADAEAKAKKVDPGNGYRLLDVDETIGDGDEYLSDSGEWKKTSNQGLQVRQSWSSPPYRRRRYPDCYMLLEPGHKIEPWDERMIAGVWCAFETPSDFVVEKGTTWRRKLKLTDLGPTAIIIAGDRFYYIPESRWGLIGGLDIGRKVGSFLCSDYVWCRPQNLPVKVKFWRLLNAGEMARAGDEIWVARSTTMSLWVPGSWAPVLASEWDLPITASDRPIRRLIKD